MLHLFSYFSAVDGSMQSEFVNDDVSEIDDIMLYVLPALSTQIDCELIGMVCVAVCK